MVTVRFAVAFVALAVALGLAWCTAAPPPAEPGSGATPGPRPSSSAAEPASDAAKAQARFDAAVGELLTANSDPSGRAVVDALVAAGFEKSQMELTPDVTAIGIDADNIQFSVLVGEECVIGQSGNVGYHSTVLPVLSTGTCLVGKTRTIDW